MEHGLKQLNADTDLCMLSLYQHKNGTSGADTTLGVPHWWSMAAGFGLMGVLMA
jgi:hypothetical protein